MIQASYCACRPESWSAGSVATDPTADRAGFASIRAYMYSIDVLSKSIRIPSQVSDEDFVVVDVVVKQVGYLLKKAIKA